MSKKTFLYIRVSTLDQVNGAESQARALLEWCTRNSITEYDQSVLRQPTLLFHWVLPTLPALSSGLLQYRQYDRPLVSTAFHRLGARQKLVGRL